MQTAGSLTEPRYATYIDKDGNPGKVMVFQPLPEGAHRAVLDGRRAVKEKLIDELGGLSDALDWLHRAIETRE